MEFKSQRNTLENTQCCLLQVATPPREEEMWASTHCSAERYDLCMNLTGKAKATATKQGKTEWNQAQGACICWQDVEVDGLPKLMWLDVPAWSPNREGKDLSQVLQLTVTPQLWAPAEAQVSALKIQLCTDTQMWEHTDTTLSGFTSTRTVASWHRDPHSPRVWPHLGHLHPCCGSSSWQQTRCCGSPPVAGT